jgi:glutamate-ammonia-ligase adenylyltransferase
MTIDQKISEAALTTPDPARAKRNLTRFFEVNPEHKGFSPYVPSLAKLFAASQHLANFCTSNPDELLAAIKERKKDITKKQIQARAERELVLDEHADLSRMMKALRIFKKVWLLRITLRDITGETDIQSSMDELTLLAEAVLSTALQWSLLHNKQKFGDPADSTIALIALGKLGGEERSDVDIMAVYDNDEGETSGVLNPAGVLYNRISNHEFYCKTVEVLNKMLSSQTEDGIAFRVDLRLRPQGQRGDIALPLKAYKTYYESWGRTWERMMLIRARPVAGDMKLGQMFIERVRPFVWRETPDFTDIEEIRGLKKKIDSTFSRNDIKRGYGGIREAEFFIQTFQLLFGGANTSLRSYRILNAIQALKWMKKVPEEDLTTLWDNYLYLRRIEHYLQMKEDLQTHTLPSSDDDLEILAKNMSYPSREDFLADLQVKRMQIKSMYNSLLGTEEDVHNEVLNLLEGGLNDDELTGYLLFRRVKEPARGLTYLWKIRDHMRIFHTSQERALSRKVIPQLIELALMSENPDRSIAGIESLLTTYGLKTAHLTAFLEQKELMEGIIKIFSASPYLTRVFLSSQHYLNILIEEWSILKTLSDIEEKLMRAIERTEKFDSALAEFRRFEEIRMGILFLLRILKIEDLVRGLSHLAEAIISEAMKKYGSRGLSVIAFGKLGGQEMSYGSDLDIVFVSETDEAMSAAEKILKTLTAYTDTGQVYSVDTRLRPDGSKGLLVKSVEGYRSYYLKNAQNWEIQALLKARPVGGDEGVSRLFMDMAKEVIQQRGPAVKKDDITAMRERIVKELAQESEGIDIKLGPGGVEEIEFYVQYLQLHYAEEFPDLLVQDTLSAVNRLAEKSLLEVREKDTLYSTYTYFRQVQTFLKLNEADVLTEGSDITGQAAKFMEHEPPEGFTDHLKMLRDNVLKVIYK